MPDGAPASELQVAAFTTLREEISRRSNAQLQLMTMSLLGFSTVVGLVVSAASDGAELLLLVPFLSCATGLLWLDHDRCIAEIGDHIHRAFFTASPEMYEAQAKRRGRRSLARIIGFLVPTAVVFAGPAVVSLLWTRGAGVHRSSPILWGAVLGLTLLYVCYFGVMLVTKVGSPGEETDTG